MKKIVVLLIVAAAVGYGLLSRHFIVFDDTVKILPKTGLRWENTIVDARGAKKLGLALKPDLIAAGINDVLMQLDRSIKAYNTPLSEKKAAAGR